tara:strand:- start:8435 stop:9043 length:609 start_codon:yes stop_codon:yes gene_type:complete
MSEKKKSDKKKEKPDIDVKDKIVHSALHLAVEQGWEYVTLHDIAAHSGVPLTGMYACIDHKDDILMLLGRMIDRRVLENVHFSEDSTTSPRDRIFDVLMDRYDILNEYREGVVSILESLKCDPKQVVISMPHICRSMSWMLEAVGIETSGIKGAVKVTGLSGLYIKVLHVWKDDESDDLPKTMAALDKALERVERMANSFGL